MTRVAWLICNPQGCLSARQAMMDKALYAYDHVAGDRFDPAITFLRAVQPADSAYETRLEVTLEFFRERIEEGYGR